MYLDYDGIDQATGQFKGVISRLEQNSQDMHKLVAALDEVFKGVTSESAKSALNKFRAELRDYSGDPNNPDDGTLGRIRHALDTNLGMHGAFRNTDTAQAKRFAM